MLLEAFERDADSLLGGLTRARYLEASGRWATLDLTSGFERFPEIHSLDAYEQLLDEDVEERVGDGLRRLVLRLYADEAAAVHDQRLVAAERSLLVDWGSQALPWRLARQLANVEPERVPRHELDEAIRAVSGPLARIRLDRIRAVRTKILPVEQYELPVDDLGFWAHVGGVAVDEVSKLAEWILEATKDLYLDALRDQLIHHKLDEGDTWEVDLEWLFRGEEYDRIFPAHLLMPSVTRALWDLEIRLEDQTHVSLDLEDPPGRVTRSFCAPIGVPDEIVATLAPRGGMFDFVSLLEIVGQAQCHAHADRTQTIVYRRLGDPAVVESYGLLFSSLLMRPEWLTLRLEGEATRDAIRLRAFERLYRLRRAAVSHLYEVELRKAEEPDALEEEYVDRFSEALMVRPFRESFLDVADEPFGGARHMRAALFAAQLSTFLEKEIDEEWYRSVRAGRFLTDRWREGQRYTAEEALARFLGYAGLDPTPLVAEIRAGLTD